MAEETRVRSRIDTGPRFREADAVRLNRLFQGADTLDMLATASSAISASSSIAWQCRK